MLGLIQKCKAANTQIAFTSEHTNTLKLSNECSVYNILCAILKNDSIVNNESVPLINTDTGLTARPILYFTFSHLADAFIQSYK